MKPPLRVLIVEDFPEDAELLVRALRREYEPEALRVDTPSALRKALLDPWDIVISDWHMPHLSATQAYEIVRERRLDVPFIIVSGTIGEETAVAAMRAGVHDFLVKGSLERLAPVIERELREAACRAENHKMAQQLAMSDRLASIGTLAAGVAHEINNPLAALIADLRAARGTLADLAKMVPPPGTPGLGPEGAERWDRVAALLGEASECLQDTQEAADRIRETAGDLRLFSRTDSEQSTLVDVRQVLDSAVRMASNATRHCARIVRCYEDVPPVLANEGRLSQVFLNLIVNAAQAVPEGNVSGNEVRLAARLDPSSKWVVVEVGDTGAGIPPENLKRIFDPFFTTKPIGIGTGLGLSICHRIITSLEGRIDVRSEVGKGSTFTVEIPASAPARPLEARPPAPGVATTRRGRVLVIDDEPMVARAVRRALGRNHDVAELTSAQVALQRIESGEEFDVILCDLMMPQMTGMELHEALVHVAPELAQRLVFLTGGAFTERARSFLERVPNVRIDKPFDSAELNRLVDERIH